MTKNTGGQAYFLNEDANSEWMKEKCYGELKRNMGRRKGFDAMMKIRCSKGLAIEKMYGNMNEVNPTEMDIANIDEDKTYVFTLKLTDKKDVREKAVIQIALVYTTEDGKRRIRVHTLGLSYNAYLTEIFKNSDLDSCVSILSRMGVEKGIEEGLKVGRVFIAEKVSEMLAVYRNNCAKNPSPGQLVLPETLKLLPVYSLGILKNKLMRPGSDISLDERVFLMHLLSTLPASKVMKLFYPSLYNMNSFFHFLQENPSYLDFSETQSFPLDKSTFLPSRLLKSSIEKDNFYLMDNGNHLYLWVSSGVDSNVLQQLLNIDSMQDLKLQKILVTPQENHLSQYFWKFVSTLRSNSPTFPVLFAVKSGEPLAFEFYQSLIEDKAQDMNYVDFLRHLHKTITKAN